MQKYILHDFICKIGIIFLDLLGREEKRVFRTENKIKLETTELKGLHFRNKIGVIPNHYSR